MTTKETMSNWLGSSPRMRGAPARCGRDLHVWGIIPAYAGSTHCTHHLYTCGWDHPRVCGEHDSKHGCMYIWQGSSPRMRGALYVATFMIVFPGIIPAYAGSTQRPPMNPRRSRDHPRVCGEHISHCRKTPRQRGSSPRMRGALEITRIELIEVGIIPAYAGSTSLTSFLMYRIKDHPRVCGEHSGRGDTVQFERGSSPRMRGAPSVRR